MLHRRGQLPVHTLSCLQVPVQFALSLHWKSHVDPPGALQSMLQVDLPKQEIPQFAPRPHVKLQLLLSVHVSAQVPVVHVKSHVCLSLQVQLGPHSPLVRGAPVSLPLSFAPLSVVPLPLSIVRDPESSASTVGSSNAPVGGADPIVQSYEQPTTSPTSARLMTRRRTFTLR
jgi:hypothetical protein